MNMVSALKLFLLIPIAMGLLSAYYLIAAVTFNLLSYKNKIVRIFIVALWPALLFLMVLKFIWLEFKNKYFIKLKRV
jgi:hypothetical protein